MKEWSWDPIWGSLWIPTLAAVGLALLLLISPSFRALSPHRRWILVSLRALAVLILFLAMVRPAFVATQATPQTQLLVILGDRSRSMQLPHVAGSQSRWEAQNETLRQLESVLSKAPPTVQVRCYSYAESLDVVPFELGKIAFPAEASGQQTDIGGALFDAVRREAGKRIAAVVLLGDGTQTASEPKTEITQAGRELARLGYPLFTVVYGPAGDASQSRDVAVESLPEQYTIFVKNELPIRGQVRVRGYANSELPIELSVENLATNEKKSLESKVVRAREDGELVTVEFPYVPQSPGQYRLTMRAVSQPGELVTKNNELTSFLTVLEGGLRVVYLYGDLNGEQRILRRSLNDSAEIELEDLYVDGRNRKQWPIDMSGFLGTKPFDVLLVESVESTAIGDKSMEAIKQLVDQGRGMMMIGGFHSFSPGGYAGSVLAPVLPVKMNRLERQDPGELTPITRDLHLWGSMELRPTRAHPVTMLAPGEENLEVWKRLPPITGANKLFNLTDRAIVLLESADESPMLIAGAYGQGRVLAFAGNTTRRWWQLGKQGEHRRFWRQAILWLAQRDSREQNDVWLRLEQRRFAVGGRINFKGGAKTANGEAIANATFDLQLVSPDGARQPIRLSQAKEQFSGTLPVLTAPGDYLMELTASAEGKAVGKTQVSFQILDRDIELSNPQAGHELMGRLAQMTADSGGRSVSIEELPAAISDILAHPPAPLVEVKSRWRLADGPADAWLLLMLFAAPMIVEWTLRNRWGLV